MSKAYFQDVTKAEAYRVSGTVEGFRLGGIFRVWCYDRNGTLRWKDTAQNMVVAEGINHILDVALVATTQITTWYVGLTDGTPTVVSGNTMASHAGWSEEQSAYSQSDRPAFTPVRSTHTVSNSSSKASFSVTTAFTTGGAFLTSAPNKGGATGTLLCAAAFLGGDKTLGDGDTLNVQYDFNAADS